MSPQEASQFIEDTGAQMLSFMFCDNAGIIRAKTAHRNIIERRIHSGVSASVAIQAATNTDQIRFSSATGPSGEIRLVPDLTTLAIRPGSNTATVLTDMVTLSHEPWGACPRHFLKRTIQSAANAGIVFQAAFEPEWYLAKTGEQPEPICQSLDNSTVGDMIARPIIHDIVRSLEHQQIPVEQIYSELGHGQHEISITHAEPLRAADNQIMYRETVRNVAWQHGYIASFAPKPFPDQAGSGCHLHISAWNPSQKLNLFYDPTSPDHLSKTAKHFISGLLKHMPALAALTYPSANSYRRIQPGYWAAAYNCYGPDNREAAIRIPSTFDGEHMQSTNIEFRPSDATANPYIALAAVITAGMDGITRGAEPNPGQYTEQDPQDIPCQRRAAANITSLPTSMESAIQELEANPLFQSAMGPDLYQSYLAVRKAEMEQFTNATEEFEIQQHFFKY